MDGRGQQPHQPRLPSSLRIAAQGDFEGAERGRDAIATLLMPRCSRPGQATLCCDKLSRLRLMCQHSNMLQEHETVGRRVRRHRLRLGMAQADLAAAMRRTQGWVSKVENDKVELDRASVINELAAALHCHPNDLLERPYPAKVTENCWRTPAAAIVRELRRYDLAPVFDGSPRPSSALWAELEALHVSVLPVCGAGKGRRPSRPNRDGAAQVGRYVDVTGGSGRS